MSETRMPTQKRSIEKRNRIIKKGFELLCENGYYNTSVPDIAKYAGVSTGLIYQYFNDKKDIFIEGIKQYSNCIMYPMIDILENKEFLFNDLNAILKNMINNAIENHTISKNAHEELMAMSHLDGDVSSIFKDLELDLTDKIVLVLINNHITTTNLKEKVHISIGLIENLCHEIVYHNHSNINYDIMKNEVINIVVNMLKN